MKRITAVFLLAALLCGLFAGCGGEDPYVPTGDGLAYDDGSTITPQATETIPEEDEQELVLVYYPELTMNPLLATDYTNRSLFSLMYQGLFATDREYNTEPILCSRYTVSEDMRTYTFYIERATFSDGSLLTIDDVLACYQAAIESTVYTGRFHHLDEVYLSEDGGITFHLDTAYENFPILLDLPIIKATELEAHWPLGTGPYYPEQTAAGLRLRRRSDWWCKADMVLTAQSIPLVVALSNTQIRDEFEFYDVGLVCTDPCSDTYADYRCDYELWDCENGTFLYLGCNTASTVFSKPKIRAALTYAIDRDTLVEKYYRSFAHSATLPASPQSPYYNAQLAQRYAYDREQFAQLINDSGLTGSSITLLVNKDDTLRLRVARAIADMLTQCGLKVEMLESSSTAYLRNLRNGKYDLYLGQTRLSPNMDLTSFFSPWGTLRYGGMTDPTCYYLCLESLANQGNYFNLHQQVMEDGRLCPILFQSYSVLATRGLLTGLTPSRDNVFYYSLGKTMTDALTAQ